jgi:hypothetical protein
VAVRGNEAALSDTRLVSPTSVLSVFNVPKSFTALPVGASAWTDRFLEVVAGASVALQMNIEYRARSDKG